MRNGLSEIVRAPKYCGVGWVLRVWVRVFFVASPRRKDLCVPGGELTESAISGCAFFCKIASPGVALHLAVDRSDLKSPGAVLWFGVAWPARAIPKSERETAVADAGRCVQELHGF